MDVQKIAEGLWRWSVPHPEWTPDCDRSDGWARDVGCIYAEVPDGVVLVDPLVPAEPAEAARFWGALDRDVERTGGRVTILVGSTDHGRSVDEVARRFRTRPGSVVVLGHEEIQGTVSCTLDATLPGAVLPGEVVAVPIEGLSPGETAYVLTRHRAVAFADCVIGAGGGRLRLAPASWGVRTDAGRALYDRRFRASFDGVLALDPEIVFTSHGAPVLAGGAAALREALTAPVWGA